MTSFDWLPTSTALTTEIFMWHARRPVGKNCQQEVEGFFGESK